MTPAARLWWEALAEPPPSDSGLAPRDQTAGSLRRRGPAQPRHQHVLHCGHRPGVRHAENAGRQPVCDEEDDRAGHAGHRAADGQRQPAQVRPASWPPARVLLAHGRPHLHLHRPPGGDGRAVPVAEPAARLPPAPAQLPRLGARHQLRHARAVGGRDGAQPAHLRLRPQPRPLPQGHRPRLGTPQPPLVAGVGGRALPGDRGPQHQQGEGQARRGDPQRHQPRARLHRQRHQRHHLRFRHGGLVPVVRQGDDGLALKQHKLSFMLC